MNFLRAENIFPLENQTKIYLNCTKFKQNLCNNLGILMRHHENLRKFHAPAGGQGAAATRTLTKLTTRKRISIRK